MTSQNTAKQGVVGRADDGSSSERVAQLIMGLRRNPNNRLLQRHVYMVGDHELTPVQVDILDTVVARPDLRMNALAKSLGVDASTVSRTVMPLIKLGLIARCHDPDDRRLTILKPSDRGLEQAGEIANSRSDLMLMVQRHMAPERLAIFADLLEDYTAAINIEGTRLAKSIGQRRDSGRYRSATR